MTVDGSARLTNAPEGDSRIVESCPTCGQAVSVQTDDDGTSYYVPVAEARHAGASAGQAAYKAEVKRLRAWIDTEARNVPSNAAIDAFLARGLA